MALREIDAFGLVLDGAAIRARRTHRRRQLSVSHFLQLGLPLRIALADLARAVQRVIMVALVVREPLASKSLIVIGVHSSPAELSRCISFGDVGP